MMRGEGGAHKTFFRENRCLSFYIRLPSLQPPPPPVYSVTNCEWLFPLSHPRSPHRPFAVPPEKERESGFPPFYFLPLPPLFS